MNVEDIRYPVIAAINLGTRFEARTIKEQYYKNSVANFLRPGGQYCATGVLEIYDMKRTLCMLGYTRDSKGKIIEYHPVKSANTVHRSTGAGGNTD